MPANVLAESMLGYGLALVFRAGEEPSPPWRAADPDDPDGEPGRFVVMTVGEYLSDPERQSGEWIIDAPVGRFIASWNEATSDWDLAAAA